MGWEQITGPNFIVPSAFAQAGASAVSRSYQDKAREQISVKDFGAKGDGTTNDTVAVQAAETYRASVGGILNFPAGTYSVTTVTVNRASGGGWTGYGALLSANASTMVFADLSGAVVSSAVLSFAINGLAFNGNGKSGVTVVREATPYFTSLNDLTITNVQYAAIFQRGRGVNISNINQYGTGCWLFTGVGTAVADRIFDVNICNVAHESLGLANWSSAPQWFYFYRCIGANMANVITASLDGGPEGVRQEGACEGLFMANVIIVYPTNGYADYVGADLVYPSYIYASNFAVDQPTITGIVVASGISRWSHINVTFGSTRSNTRYGIEVTGPAYDSKISGVRISDMNNDGLVIQANTSGITPRNISVSGGNFLNNHVSAGTDVFINDTATNFIIYDSNWGTITNPGAGAVATTFGPGAPTAAFKVVRGIVTAV